MSAVCNVVKGNAALTQAPTPAASTSISRAVHFQTESLSVQREINGSGFSSELHHPVQIIQHLPAPLTPPVNYDHYYKPQPNQSMGGFIQSHLSTLEWEISLDLGCEITHWRWKFRLRNTSRLLLKRFDTICMSSSSSLFCYFVPFKAGHPGVIPPPTSPHRSAKLISFHPELQKHQRHLLIAGSDYCYYIKITQSH